ncbi:MULTISPECIES: signal peptidase I [unclassified Colwellia]|uniref:signal peptidase I n=1 Tax=unclassified Colwellia TaxID=196834 RepID=UPI0015F3DFDB|nr:MULTISPECIES: signal peptidase I [unclassified Colwellia]MBA6356625.1 signal peptidase I [Colwellia sp. BRX8-3]MBA6361185.1 signal peptidase I [Colwellia sp. BRX8-6]MBA6368401.1 signal peptidase I [Colwellia sp. BRX8-5]MBA6377339.1 signal peptidase I [Colwellia sp. BRX8-2]
MSQIQNIGRRLKENATLQKFIYSYLENKKLCWFVIIILVVRTFFVSYYHIPTSSMNPSLMEGDIVLVNKLAYNVKIPFTDVSFKLGSPKRGDVVTFDINGINMAKRIVAVGGDTIQFIDNRLYVNKKVLSLKRSFNKLVNGKRFERQKKYQYLNFSETNDYNYSYDIVYATGFTKEHLSRLITNTKPFTIPKHKYFALGDNRNLSKDSRYLGTVHEKDVISKIEYVFFNYTSVWNYFFGDVTSLRFFEVI